MIPCALHYVTIFFFFRQILFLWHFLADQALTPQIFEAFISFFTHLLDLENPETRSVVKRYTDKATNSPSQENQHPRVQVFEQGVLGVFFETALTEWASKESSLDAMNSTLVAEFCFRLFFLVNMDPQVKKDLVFKMNTMMIVYR